ncbi:unnamed protein product [Effrenium voratum]|uniref:Uncharacterized protein n=1 Tax=Effrenium voratum TaxID=2562239 RepID=A0AA36N0F0_9DINO|nr:unnamed protein product [Effrenium voratum]
MEALKRTSSVAVVGPQAKSNPWNAAVCLIRLFWWDSDWRCRAEAFARIAAVIGVQLFRGKSRIWLSQVKRKQLQHLLSGSLDRWVVAKTVLQYLAAILVLSPVSRLYYRLFRGLRLQWEGHLTKHFLGKFLEAQCFGHRARREEEHDDRNPDQRIAADVGKFTSLATILALDGFQALVDLYFYSRLLWTLSPVLSRLAVFAATFGTLLTQWLGRELPALYSAERAADGMFIYVLTRMRENAESILFFGGEGREVQRAEGALQERQASEWKRLAAKDVVQLVQDQYRQALSLSPSLVLVQVAGVAQDAALLNQANEAFDAVVRALLLVADNCSDFSRLSAVALELHSYHLEQLEDPAETSRIRIQAVGKQEPWLEVKGLTLCLADRTLVKDLCFEAPASGGLLISGPSGAGKTTLLRALAGLWHKGTGEIKREMREGHVLFLPQRPYMSLGTLREQLLYPNPKVAADDAYLHEVLLSVGLQGVLQRLAGDLDAVRRWDEQLSVGEQQRLSVARLLVQRPSYALVDEVTSANDPHHEEMIYNCLASTCRAFVSVGHRQSLEAFHAWNLRLEGDGKWTLKRIGEKR